MHKVLKHIVIASTILMGTAAHAQATQTLPDKDASGKVVPVPPSATKPSAPAVPVPFDLSTLPLTDAEKNLLELDSLKLKLIEDKLDELGNSAKAIQQQGRDFLPKVKADTDAVLKAHKVAAHYDLNTLSVIKD